jgi:hypothetical protein
MGRRRNVNIGLSWGVVVILSGVECPRSGRSAKSEDPYSRACIRAKAVVKSRQK